MPSFSVTGVQDGWAVLPALGWLLVPRVFPCYLQGFRLLPSMLGFQVPINTICQERALPHRTLSLCFSCANAEQQQDAQPLTQDSASSVAETLSKVLPGLQGQQRHWGMFLSCSGVQPMALLLFCCFEVIGT